MRFGARGRQVRPLRVPDVLLAVGREDLAGGGDEVCCVVEEGLALVLVSFDNSPRNKTDTQLLGDMLVG